MPAAVMNVMQVTYQNPDASEPMLVPVVVLPNVPEDEVNRNITRNSALDLPWFDAVPAHDGVAVICGGGPSLDDCYMDILAHSLVQGTTVFGLNGAATWLCDRAIACDYQIILDAKPASAGLVELDARERLYSSAVHPDTADHATALFHLANSDIEEFFPQARREQGGYTLVGGGVSVGITAMVVAYTLGFRTLHLYGYDSSNRAEATHAYDQPMNAFMPTIDVTWAGKTYTSSMPMKLQAEAFPGFARALEDEGCTIHLHGDGLLPAMWFQEPMTEREKYQKIWLNPDYRATSPGEHGAARFIEIAKPDATVIDFGCGTGRGALAIHEATGLNVILIDFTDNCRDKASLKLPFIQWDLTQPIPVKAPFGYCADVMEHIPPASVETVLRNIMASAERCFFQISTRHDNFGITIGQRLHLSVHSLHWWRLTFESLGYRVEWAKMTACDTACLYIANPSDG